MWRRAFEVERRDAHQPVHAGLGLQPAIGVGPEHLHGGRLDAQPARRRSPRRTPPPCRGPAPSACTFEQHVGPVVGLGAAGAGVDLHIAVVGVGLARQQRLELGARRRGPSGAPAGATHRPARPRRPRHRRARRTRPRRRARAPASARGRPGRRAGFDRASGSARRRRRPRGSGPRPARSAHRGDGGLPPSQRRLLSSSIDCSISAAACSISALIGAAPLGVRQRR